MVITRPCGVTRFFLTRPGPDNNLDQDILRFQAFSHNSSSFTTITPTMSMLELSFYALATLTAVIYLAYLRLERGISYPGGVPRVGGPGVLGYISTALRYTFDAEPVIIEGREKFSGRPFVVPTLAGAFHLWVCSYMY